jgi:hypothetical protein
MQLVAYGAQDVYLTGNPQITFFKVVYRRHTNFAIESIEQPFTGGTADFGRKVVCQVARNADLMHRVYLQVDLPALSGTDVYWVKNVGNVLISEVSIEIGGQQIDKHYGIFMHIWNQLTVNAEKKDGYDVMIGNTTTLTTNEAPTTSTPATTLYVPFRFWFCENAGLALPLIALQYHDVRFNVTFRSLADVTLGTVSGTPALANASLYVDYIYLDTDERRQFAQVQHEYLIEQLQFTGEESYAASTTNVNTKINFNHPVKELIWVFQQDSDATAKSWTTFNNSAAHILSTAKLQLNGQDRFSARKAEYFNYVQPYQHHTRIPEVGVYSYSFALNPEQHQPSGSVNMSRIDNATFNFVLASGAAAGKLRVYARNNNVLRIMAGMGGLAYSN